MLMRNKIEVDLNALDYNIKTIRNHLPENTKILLVAKGNAYGHGAVETCKNADVDYIGVAVEEEGVELRESGITKPILIMAPPTYYHLAAQYDLTLTIFNKTHLKHIEELKSHIKAHIKVDTGLRRVGTRDVKLFYRDCFKVPNLIVEGLYTHLATAEYGLGIDLYMHNQQQKFSSVAGDLNIPIRHIMNTSGAIKDPKNAYEMVRIGIGAYGYDPTRRLNLKPVMTLLSKVTHTSTAWNGSSVGYGANKVDKGKELAVLGLGWGDGFTQGHVIINGVECEIIQVCMDQTIVDASFSNAVVGDIAIIYPPADKIKKFVGCLRKRIPRIYVREVNK